MLSVIVWFLDHFTLEYVPSVNGVWIIGFVSHLHVWVTKFEPSFMFFKLPVLKSNNVVWMPFSAILFDETQHVVKTSTTGYVPVFYEVINLFIRSENFLWMGFYWIVTAYDGLLIFFLNLFNSCIKPTWNNVLHDVLLKRLTLVFSRVYNDIKDTGQ